MKTIAVIPCFDEESSIADIVHKCNELVDMVVVADDCSTDNTVNILADDVVFVRKFTKRQGTGANTKQGIDEALVRECDIVVTLDGDGQHNPKEIPRVIKPIIDGDADFVIGSRFMRTVETVVIDNHGVRPMWKGRVSKFRKFGIDVITWLYNLGNKQKTTDAQCCFRAFRRNVLEEVGITERGFAFSVETIIKARAKGFKIVDVPVSCIYHKQFSQNSSMNPVSHGLNVALACVKWRVKIEVMDAVQNLLFRVFKKAIRPLVGYGLSGIRPLGWLYKLIARNLIPAGERIVEINGYKMQVRIERGRDIDGISQHLIFEHEYEPLMTRVFKQVVKEGMKVVDIGANIGYYSLLASKLVGNNGVVYAFEPETENYAGLLANRAINNMPNIIGIKKAVSDGNGTAELIVSAYESGAHSLVDCRGKVKEKVMVETVTLDSLFPSGGIDVIKSDTEGNEMAVLQGGHRAISQSGSIKVFVEFYPPGIKASGHEPLDFWLLLHRLGFDYIYLMDEQLKIIRRSDFDFAIQCHKRHKFSVNLLCSKEDLKL